MMPVNYLTICWEQRMLNRAVSKQVYKYKNQFKFNVLWCSTFEKKFNFKARMVFLTIEFHL